MQRITISLDESTAAAIDAFMTRHGYSNRSEAVRDLVRDSLVRIDAENAEMCVAAISYVYRYDGRDLAMRLDRAQHDHHDLSLSSMRTRLDHRHCMEVTFLKGRTEAVKKLADTILAERGVRFGQMNLVPVRIESIRHSHGEGPSHEHHTPAI